MLVLTGWELVESSVQNHTVAASCEFLQNIVHTKTLINTVRAEPICRRHCHQLRYLKKKKRGFTQELADSEATYTQTSKSYVILSPEEEMQTNIPVDGKR